ncbi:MAG: hypothetical protein V2A70_00080 [Candidatus Omnitrophota bacterium]
MTDLVVPVKTIIKYFAIICLVLAFLLLIWPDAFIRMNLFFKKWFSTDKFERELNRTRDIDAQLLNMRKVLGIISLVLALVFILTLIK